MVSPVPVPSRVLRTGPMLNCVPGNFHALLLFTDDKELPAVREAVHRIIERALAMEGTCTGEHGVGIGKKEYLYEELGHGTVDLMKKIKSTSTRNARVVVRCWY